MKLLPIFATSVPLGLFAGSVVLARHAWPRLARASLADAARPVLLHAFRFVGLALLLPGSSRAGFTRRRVFIATLLVPLLLVTHALLFMQLLRGGAASARTPAPSARA